MKKAFTLVELIVVITILAILWTIAFMSFQGYSKDARDAKRIQDVRNLLNKLNLKNTTWISYTNMLDERINYDKKIAWIDKLVTGWIADFAVIQENNDNFLDPENWWNYDFATVQGRAEYNWKEQKYSFIQARYWSEKNNKQVIMGNYYKYEQWDAENLFYSDLTWDEKWNNYGLFVWGVTPASMHCVWVDIIIKFEDWTRLTVAWCNLADPSPSTHLSATWTNNSWIWNPEEHYYSWNLDNSSTVVDPCPTWRRLPSYEECWKILPFFEWRYTPNWVGSPFFMPLSGFSVNWNFWNIGVWAGYWSTEEIDSTYSWALWIGPLGGVTYDSTKAVWLSVRCVK